MNFEIVNAKNLKDGIFEKLVKYGISLRFQSLASIQRYKRGFVGKNREIKLKIQDDPLDENQITCVALKNPESYK